MLTSHKRKTQYNNNISLLCTIIFYMVLPNEVAILLMMNLNAVCLLIFDIGYKSLPCYLDSMFLSVKNKTIYFNINMIQTISILNLCCCLASKQ